MSEPIWNQFLTERDKAVFSAAGYGARAGFGKRPALLVIDVSYAFTGDTPGEPILESIKRWRNSCGAESWDRDRPHQEADRQGAPEAAARDLHDRCAPPGPVGLGRLGAQEHAQQRSAQDREQPQRLRHRR